MELTRRTLPLLDREQELASFAPDRDLPARPHLIKGGPGIGKTRLLERFVEQEGETGVATVLARCYESNPAISFFPLLNAIEMVVPGESVEHCSAENGDSQASPIHQANASDSRLGLFYKIRGRLEELSRTRPLLIAVDDVQWADADTLLLLNYLADHGLEQLKIVLTARDASSKSSFQPQLLSLEEKSTILELKGLSRTGSTQIATTILGPLRPHEIDFIHEVTRGNPLFLSTLATRLVSSGLLDQWSIQEAMQRLDIPQTLTGIITSQISSITPELTGLLQEASCIGVRFDARLLAAASSQAPEAIETSMAEANREGLIRPSGAPEPTEFQFVSPLIHERLYKEMPDQKRREVHHRLADYGNRNTGVLSLEELAIHSASGLDHSQPQAAFLACESAAERAERAFAFDQAAGFWSLALSCLQATDVRRRAEVLIRLGLTRRAAKNWAQAITAFQRAHELFDRLSEAESAAEAAYFLGEMYRFTLDLQESVRWLRLSLDSLAEELRPNAQALLGGALIAQDHVEEGMLTLQPLLTSRDSRLEPHVAFWASYGLASAGKIAASSELLEAGLREAQRLNNRTQIILTGGQLASRSLSNLRLDQAKEYVELIASIPQPLDATAIVRMFVTQAMLDAYRGNWRAVEETCTTWMPEVRLAGRFQQATAEIHWAEASSALGNHEEALAMAEKALPYLGDMTPLATLHKARILLQSGRKDAAKESVLGVAEKVQASTHSPGSLLVLADLAASIGDSVLAKPLRAKLLQEPRQLLIIYAPISVQRVLGKLASLLGDHAAAFGHFEAAIKGLSSGGAAHELAYTYLDYSNARSRRTKRGDALKAQSLSLAATAAFEALNLPQPFRDEADVPQSGGSRYGLTPRQLEVLQLVAQGAKNKEIAELLSLTPTTVARHLEAILGKMGASNRTDAVMKAQRAGLLASPALE